MQLVQSSSEWGLTLALVAMEKGLLGDADRRALLLSHHDVEAEIYGTLRCSQSPVLKLARDKFDLVLDLNDLISPYHPDGWSVTNDNYVSWRHLLLAAAEARTWEVDSIVTDLSTPNLTSALGAVFPGTALHTYAFGLNAYGPGSARYAEVDEDRLGSAIYVDLLPGVTPHALEKFGNPTGVSYTTFATTTFSLLHGLCERPNEKSWRVNDEIQRLAFLVPLVVENAATLPIECDRSDCESLDAILDGLGETTVVAWTPNTRTGCELAAAIDELRHEFPIEVARVKYWCEFLFLLQLAPTDAIVVGPAGSHLLAATLHHGIEACSVKSKTRETLPDGHSLAYGLEEVLFEAATYFLGTKTIRDGSDAELNSLSGVVATLAYLLSPESYSHLRVKAERTLRSEQCIHFLQTVSPRLVSVVEDALGTSDDAGMIDALLEKLKALARKAN